MRERPILPIPARFSHATDKDPKGHSEIYKVISLFSGCGGMDLGFRGGFQFGKRYYDRLPFDVVWANDINRAACQTYKLNLGHAILEGDIAKVMDTLPKRADVVIGGFRCQDVSINGKQAGIDGERTILYRRMVEVVAR